MFKGTIEKSTKEGFKKEFVILWNFFTEFGIVHEPYVSDKRKKSVSEENQTLAHGIEKEVKDIINESKGTKFYKNLSKNAIGYYSDKKEVLFYQALIAILLIVVVLIILKVNKIENKLNELTNVLLILSNRQNENQNSLLNLVLASSKDT